MAFKVTTRNYDGIQHEALRKIVDPKFNVLHDSLTAAYYDYWKKGLSHPWNGHDVQSTPEESKALFDKLHGLIFHLRHLEFHSENLKQPVKDRIDSKEYDDIHDDTGVVTGTKTDLATAKIAALKAEGIEIK